MSDHQKIVALFHHQFDQYEKFFNDFKSITRFINRLKIETNIKQLNIDNSAIEQDFQKHGVIVLRPYKGETTLIIGCGNNPSFRNYTMEIHEIEREYKAHLHTGCYTIDLDPSMNCSVVGAFSYQTFGNIPDNAFSEIITEGVILTETPIYHTEILRLLKEGGSLMTGDDIYAKTNNKLVFQKKDFVSVEMPT